MKRLVLLLLLAMASVFAYNFHQGIEHSPITLHFLFSKENVINVTITIFQEGQVVKEFTIDHSTNVVLEPGKYIIVMTYPDGTQRVIPEYEYNGDETIVVPIETLQPGRPISLSTAVSISLFLIAILLFMAQRKG